MASKSKSKKTKKTKYKDGFGWAESGFSLKKSVDPLKVLKLFSEAKNTEFAKGKSSLSSMSWLMPGKVLSTIKQLEDWNKRLCKSTPQPNKVATEMIELTSQLPDKVGLSEAVLILGSAQILRGIAFHCQFSDWYGMVRRFLDLSRDVESTVDTDSAVYQLMAVELPLTIAFQFPEVEDFKDIASRSCRKLEVSATDMLDHDGWPLGRYLKRFGVLVASWVRCNRMARKLKIEFKSDVAAQLEWLVRQSIRLLRPEGAFMFSPDDTLGINEAFLRSFKKLSRDPVDERLIKAVFHNKVARKMVKAPATSNLSEWAEGALLQSRWSSNSPKVGIDYSNKQCILEISRDASLVRGNCLPAISVDGKLVQPSTDFEVVCNHSDEDLEYLELELTLGDDDEATLNRQFILIRESDVLVMADAVLVEEPAVLNYECGFPLAPGIQIMEETETCEVYLRSGGIQSLVLPLAVPEWKSARTDSRLLIGDQQLTLHQKERGLGLYAPLVFDLNPQRSRQKRTWRQLTVGEERHSVPHDVARAFRFQLNRDQWFFYKSISRRGNRTFLGENFNGEFVFNRFEKDGTVKQLIQIDD